jgi:hypothetical protein
MNEELHIKVEIAVCWLYCGVAEQKRNSAMQNNKQAFGKCVPLLSACFYLCS